MVKQSTERTSKGAKVANSSEAGERLGGRSAEVREVAVRLFYERGYHGTSLRDIGTALGLRAPSLYNHITSKQQMLQDLMFDNTMSLRSSVEAAIGSGEGPAEQVRLAVEALIRHAARHRFQVHVSMFEVPSVEEPARTQVLRLRADNAARWRELVRSGVKTGVFLTPNPDLAAQSILDLGAGVAHWYRPEGGVSEEELIAFYSDLALRIVGATS